MPPKKKGGVRDRAALFSATAAGTKCELKSEKPDKARSAIKRSASDDADSLRSVPHDDDAAPELYRANLAQILITNKLSGKDLRETADYASNAGARGVHDLAKAGAGGRHPGNIKRDLRRKVLRGSPMPEVYLAAIPVADPDTKTKQLVWMPILLLHEMLFWFISTSKIALADVVGTMMPIASGLKSRFQTFCDKHGIDFNLAIANGLHGDGVPLAKKPLR